MHADVSAPRSNTFYRLSGWVFPPEGRTPAELQTTERALTPVTPESSTSPADAPRRRLSVLGVLLTGVLALSACSGSPREDAQADSPNSAPAASSNPSATDGIDEGAAEESSSAQAEAGDDRAAGGDEYVPASSETPAQNAPMPDRPPEMSREAGEGAEAAVEYWFELFEYARLSGDTEPLRSMSQESCDKCASDLENIDAIYDVDGWYAEVEYTVDDSELSVRNGRAEGAVRVSSPGFRSYEADGTEHESDGMDGSLFQMKMTFADDQWQVADWASMREGRDDPALLAPSARSQILKGPGDSGGARPEQHSR